MATRRDIRILAILLLLLVAIGPAAALPVPLGSMEIGLESYDGFQEGLAYLSTDETGSTLEILIGYKGFGLDTVTWTFPESELSMLRGDAAQAAWWRSRLLEIDVDQRVLRDMSAAAPTVTYVYRGNSYVFDAAENLVRFVRQGRDYALLLTETSPGAETRRSGSKILPVFTIHFSGAGLTILRDMLSEENVNAVLAAYAGQKSAIDAILDTAPD